MNGRGRFYNRFHGKPNRSPDSFRHPIGAGTGFEARAGHVMGVQQLVRLMAAGLAQVLRVNLFNQWALMALAQRQVFVLVIKGLGALGLQVGEIAHIGGLNRLAATVDAAARAAHDLDEPVIRLAALRPLTAATFTSIPAMW